MAFKKIRDLEAFDGTTPLNTGDFLVVSDADGESTRRTTIKEAVSSYNLAVTEELQAQPDTITNSDGQEVPNPLADIVTQVEVVDTDGDGNPDTEILLDTTPITSENIDKLVKPGGGLEIIEVCKDIEGTIVDCTIGGNPNPQVAIKSKQLSLATSEASKKIDIFLNADEGQEYSASQSYSINLNGQLTNKFSRLRDAYAYIRNNIPSKSVTVNLFIETDLDEGTLTPNDQAAYQSGGMFLVNIRGWHSDNHQLSILSSEPQLRKIKAACQSIANRAHAMFWMNSITEIFQSLHFCIDNTDHDSSHSVFRSDGEASNNLKFYACKLSFRGRTHALIEASRGGKISFGSITSNADSLDPLNKGFWMPAFEFDFKPKVDNTQSHVTHLLDMNRSATIENIEYGGRVPWEANPYTTWQGRVHVCGASSLQLKHFMYLEAACLYESNTVWTADFGNTAFSYQANEGIIRAVGFNTIKINDNSNIDGAADSFGFGNTDIGIPFAHTSSTEGTDYVANFGALVGFDPLNPTNPFVSVQNALPARGIDGPVNLTNYFPNHTF